MPDFKTLLCQIGLNKGKGRAWNIIYLAAHDRDYGAGKGGFSCPQRAMQAQNIARIQPVCQHIAKLFYPVLRAYKLWRHPGHKWHSPCRRLAAGFNSDIARI